MKKNERGVSMSRLADSGDGRFDSGAQHILSLIVSY